MQFESKEWDSRSPTDTVERKKKKVFLETVISPTFSHTSVLPPSGAHTCMKPLTYIMNVKIIKSYKKKPYLVICVVFISGAFNSSTD